MNETPNRRHFFIVGAQRSSTTFFYSLLDGHPQIAMAKPMRPEPKFFLADESSKEGVDAYFRRFFSHAAATAIRYGEKSTSYYESEIAARRIAGAFPDADIFLVVRNPVDRAISNARFSQVNGFEKAPLQEALVREIDGGRIFPDARDSARVSVSPFAYLARGRYVEHLEKYEAWFPRAQIHVLLAEKLTSNRSVITNVYETLGVETNHQPERFSERVNQNEGPAADISPRLRKRLLDYFSEPNRRLAERFGVDISSWQQ